jgi:hypothetical protein
LAYADHRHVQIGLEPLGACNTFGLGHFMRESKVFVTDRGMPTTG